MDTWILTSGNTDRLFHLVFCWVHSLNKYVLSAFCMSRTYCCFSFEDDKSQDPENGSELTLGFTISNWQHQDRSMWRPFYFNRPCVLAPTYSIYSFSALELYAFLTYSLLVTHPRIEAAPSFSFVTELWSLRVSQMEIWGDSQTPSLGWKEGSVSVKNVFHVR